MSSTTAARRYGSVPAREETIRVTAGSTMEHGGDLADWEIAYSDTGPAGSPAIAVLGGISAHLHVTDAGGRQGWWHAMAGPGAPLDPRFRRIVSFDYLGGPGGSTWLGGTDPRAASRRITTRDQADALAAVVHWLGARPLHGLVGASYGGAVAIAFAARHPDLLRGAFVIGATHASHPLASAIRWVQREIVRRGVEAGSGRDSVALARALAITTYGSDRDWARRYGDAVIAGGDSGLAFEADLLEKGLEFAERWTPEQYTTLSRSLDDHSVDPAAIRVPLTLVSVEPDFASPRWQVEQLAARTRGRCRVVRVDSEHGHDAFLEDAAAIAPALVEFLDDPELER